VNEGIRWQAAAGRAAWLALDKECKRPAGLGFTDKDDQGDIQRHLAKRMTIEQNHEKQKANISRHITSYIYITKRKAFQPLNT
jgi:hypothetical protein